MTAEFLRDYLPIILFLIIALGLSCAFIVINFILSPKNPDPEKLSAYECGFEPFQDSRMEFDVRFYLVAILFIIFLVIALGLSCAFVAINFILSPKRPDPEKLSAYECGFEPFEDSRMEFDVRFYLVAILFIIFDLEIAFLFPWAISLGNIGLLGFSSMMIFLFILTIGFIYEWKKGALDWE